MKPTTAKIVAAVVLGLAALGVIYAKPEAAGGVVNALSVLVEASSGGEAPVEPGAASVAPDGGP